MALDGIAVDLEGFGRLDDIAFIYDEPVQVVMPLQVVGIKAAFPQTIQDGETAVEFGFGDPRGHFESHFHHFLVKLLKF